MHSWPNRLIRYAQHGQTYLESVVITAVCIARVSEQLPKFVLANFSFLRGSVSTSRDSDWRAHPIPPVGGETAEEIVILRNGSREFDEDRMNSPRADKNEWYDTLTFPISNTTHKNEKIFQS
jgi:hypothetical protein